jgi:hypothetical protein
MLALSIRQPYAELILRGIKTVEYRSRPTRIVGERFYIYASKKKLPVASGQLPVTIWSEDLATAGELPDWMAELAEQVGMIEAGALLPMGVIVGTAEVARCELLVASDGPDRPLTTNHQPSATSTYAWHLVDVQRAEILRKPRRHPQPVWFRPF